MPVYQSSKRFDSLITEGWRTFSSYFFRASEKFMARCILIVDDNIQLRRAIRVQLEAAGLEVCGEAVDGLDAIEKARGLSPDLIVLDLSMPRMNGLEAARKLAHI